MVASETSRRPDADRAANADRPVARTGTLALMFYFATAFAAFMALVETVQRGRTEAFDRAVLLALRNPADQAVPFGPGWLQEMMRDFTALGGAGITTLLLVGAAAFLWMQRNYRSLFLVLAATLSGRMLSAGLKLFFDRPRPELVPHGSIVYSTSFPSGHTMAAAITYLTLAALIARVQPKRRMKSFVFGTAIVLTVLVGVSRVYLGVHWPSDVAAGWAVGIAWAMLWWIVARWLDARGVVEPERDAASEERGTP